MALRQWLFDYPTDGVTLNTSNIHSEDEAAPQQVNASGGTIQSSTAQVQAGTTSVRFEHSATVGVIRLPLVAASQQLAISLYLYRPAVTVLEGFCAIRHASGPVAHLQTAPDGALAITLPSGGGSVFGAAGDVPTDTWVRIEAIADTAAATLMCTSYLGDSTTPIGSVSQNALNVASPMTHIDIGRPAGTTGGFTDYFDSVQTNDGTTTPIGPYVPPAPPETNAYIGVGGAWIQADPYIRVNNQWVLTDPSTL